MITYRDTISDKDALTVSCPLCSAAAGAPCTYAPTVNTARWAHTELSRSRQARVGQPTLRPHNRRREAAWQKRRRVSHAQQCPAPPRQRKLVTPVVTLRQFDLAEWHAMRHFLTRDGHILWSKP
jgi:hypothetical protein